MPAPGAPLFLERRRYRLRRIMDAARLLPLVGVLLWMIPLLWPTGATGEGEGVPMSQALLYIFAVWLGLIVISLALWARIRTAPEDADTPIDQSGAD